MEWGWLPARFGPRPGLRGSGRVFWVLMWKERAARLSRNENLLFLSALGIYSCSALGYIALNEVG